jgi:hypothetical protein
MSFTRTSSDRRRGATPRRRRLRFDPGAIDRWLDRLVVAAVITALVIGSVALALTLLL